MVVELHCIECSNSKKMDMGIATVHPFLCFFYFSNCSEKVMERACRCVCFCVDVCVSYGIMENKSAEKVRLVSAHSFLWVTDGVVGRM